MATVALAVAQETKTQAFYRPELDVLRFVAFLTVFICHGPRLHVNANAPWWKLQIANAFNTLAHSGAYGVRLFFLLSSYLITELLLREQKKTGRIHLKAFYVRR